MNRPFRFEAGWVSHEDFGRVVRETSHQIHNLDSNLTTLTSQLKEWNTEVFGNIFKRKKGLLARLQGIQNSPRYGYNNFLETLQKEVQEQLALTLHQEECF